jgi:hypothetical protein
VSTMQLHKTLPTKTMPALARRRPAGQTFYLTVIAISLLAAVSLLRTLGDGSGTARHGQLMQMRSLGRRGEEVWYWQIFATTFAD